MRNTTIQLLEGLVEIVRRALITPANNTDSAL
jgi:hypothetical protein